MAEPAEDARTAQSSRTDSNPDPEARASAEAPRAGAEHAANDPHDRPPSPPSSRRPHDDGAHEPMPEGEERPPRGVTVMAIVRWLLVLAMATAATASIGSIYGLKFGHASQAQRAIWYCPMHPAVTSDHAGECPICGMDLVERAPANVDDPALPPMPSAKSKSHAGHRHEPTDPFVSPMHPEESSLTADGRCPICGMRMVPRAEVPEAVEIAKRALAQKTGQAPLDPKVPGLGPVDLSFDRVQLIGMKTAKVVQRRLGAELRATGWVVAREDGLSKVSARFAGWIEGLSVAQTGAKVTRGQLLATAYSPQVMAAEREMLAARGVANAVAATTAEPMTGMGATTDAGIGLPLGNLGDEARKRLEILGVPEGEIAAVERDGKARRTVGIYAPAGGYVVQKSAVLGQYVQPGTELFTVADLSDVWVVADVPEAELARVKIGDSATLALAAFPDRPFVGAIDFIYPSVDAGTRTARVRFAFKNADLSLKPGMAGTVKLASAAATAADAPTVLLVPSEAIVDTGALQYVFVQKSEGKFEPRRVRVGRRDDGAVEILEGLAVDELVVTTGNFLLDSESRLRAAIEAPKQTEGGAR